MPFGFTEAEVMEMISAADSNNDGEIQFDEFEAGLAAIWLQQKV